MTLRWRELAPQPKALVDDLEVTYALGQRVHPDMPPFGDWVAALLLNASAAVRAAYEQELEAKARDGG